MDRCDHCLFELPGDALHCPHCCFGQRALNVVKAREKSETFELERRYQAAIKDAKRRGCAAQVAQFETEIAADGRLVMGTSKKKLMPLIRGDRDVFATYYDLEALRFPQPATGPIDWNTKRPQAEIELLGTHKHIDKLHYAALSLDGESLPHYGDCTIWLAPHMVTHRASLLTENSVICFLRHNAQIPPGHRASWDDRTKLCVAKLAGKIEASTVPADFPKLIMKPGPDTTGIGDEFVEIQILGEMTIRTFERVKIKRQPATAGKSVSSRSRSKRGNSCPKIITDYFRNNDFQCEPSDASGAVWTSQRRAHS